MQASNLSRKLLIGPGQRVLLVNAPAGYLDRLSPLPEGASVAGDGDGPWDQVQLFADNRSQLESGLPAALQKMKPDGTLWAAYPDPDAGKDSDLSRDHGWGACQVAGLVEVIHLSVDRDWKAHQFRRRSALPNHAKAVPAADLLPVGPRATLAFRAVLLLAGVAFHSLFRFSVSGRENVPEGAYVAIANHLGWMDAVSLLLYLPREPRVHFLADPDSMMRNRPLWALVRATGGIVPVDRAKHADPTLFRHVLNCLGLGGSIALFPEGDFGPREGELQPFRKGFAYFAVESGAPVLPVALSGMKEVWLGKRLAIRIGEPIPVEGRKVEEILRLGEEAMKRLLPAYAEGPGPKPLRRWLTGLF